MRPRGHIEELPSGALRVLVYAGTDPITGKRYNLSEVIPAGPDAPRRAEKVLNRLVHQVDESRHPKTNATINQLLDRYLEQSTVARNTKSTYRTNIDKHIRPLIGHLKVGRLDSEIVDSFYAELRRCRAHCTSKRRIDHRMPGPHACDERCRAHECRPLDHATVRKIHNILSGALHPGMIATLADSREYFDRPYESFLRDDLDDLDQQTVLDRIASLNLPPDEDELVPRQATLGR